jgi:hypothetical protein
MPVYLHELLFKALCLSFADHCVNDPRKERHGPRKRICFVWTCDGPVDVETVGNHSTIIEQEERAGEQCFQNRRVRCLKKSF